MTVINYDRRIIARHNPRLAYILECIKAPLAPVEDIVRVTFTDVTNGQMLPGAFPKEMSSDAWIVGMEYTVRAPLAFAGSILKPQYDQNMKLNPYIDVYMQFKGGASLYDDNIITKIPLPLEQVAKAAGNPDPYHCAVGNWHVIQKSQDFQVNFFLKRTLGALEVPYEVTLAVKMYQIDQCCLRDINESHARECLLKMGLLEKSDVANKGA